MFQASSLKTSVLKVNDGMLYAGQELLTPSSALCRGMGSRENIFRIFFSIASDGSFALLSPDFEDICVGHLFPCVLREYNCCYAILGSQPGGVVTVLHNCWSKKVMVSQVSTTELASVASTFLV